MHQDQVDALVEAAASGTVERDGLSAGRTAEGYVFETPEDRLESLSEGAFREACEANPWYVSNWAYWARDRPDHERAFLRWVERADEHSVPERYEALAEGVARTWGELSVTATLGSDGERRYRLCHEADADADPGALEVRADPLDARELVKYDERGRYRPLKTAPTLPSGWAFVDLDGAALVRAVDVVYPATVANWHRERRGELDVSHWTETMARQTGIYGVIETWNRGEGHDHVDRVAEACCVDSQCLKRREWEYDEETPLDVPGGDGEFPCREPCSLVVAAARQWTRLEGETSRTYEFELTPSEKAQLEEIVDAVADGRVDEIREADVYDGANRYRARYLRAKRFDDEGRLCGVPTREDDDGNGGEENEGDGNGDGGDRDDDRD